MQRAFNEAAGVYDDVGAPRVSFSSFFSEYKRGHVSKGNSELQLVDEG